MSLPALDKEAVKTYYGEVLTKSKDLKTNACRCGVEGLSPSVKAALAEINDEVMSRFYGCGSPIPPLLEGAVVLDLGCGTGRDVFVAARLAGPKGRVIGVDMTEEQVAVAQRNLKSQMQRFGYDVPNVAFHLGGMEDLRSAGIADHSVDVVMSNCVINLAPVKKAVFAEIFRVLKPGGELIFSDVFADRRVPLHLQTDPELHGECLAGALYWEDFRRLLADLGCRDVRILSSRKLEIGSREVEDRIGMVDFRAVTVRAFALPSLEDRCEDYGQSAVYEGGIPDHPHAFDLDVHHRFITGKPMLVCGNTASMLTDTRYAGHFTVTGDRSIHFGLFNCGPAPMPAPESTQPGACC